MSKKPGKTSSRTPTMPPRMPQDDAEFERAVLLLGALTKGNALTKKTADELEELLGVIPSREVAVFWKTQLKKLRKERAESTDET